MICPKCSREQDDANLECSRCGLIFKKYREPQFASEKPASRIDDDENEAVDEDGGVLSRVLFFVEPQVNPIYFAGRILVFLLIAVWGLKLVAMPMQSNYVGSSFMHLINLPFHEAGHVFFRPLGPLLTSLGGTLGQLLMPLICLFTLLLKYKNTFGAAVCLWWFGENLLDIAPYINDARELKLMLLGGNTGQNTPYGFHDWEFILTETGLLRHDHLIAGIVFKLGACIMVMAIVWALYLLYKQYRRLDLA